ncbi:MAG: DNA-binding protein [Acidobacteria bacterium]|nr:DNA-binding protein [Acidobacteriota bacterium]
MSYTLGEAAKATGKSKPTIARAIKRSLISATKTLDGSYQIDPAELSRVFQLASNGSGTMKQSVPGEGDDESLVRLLAERDRLVMEQAETIRDLRARLDTSEAERRRVQERLTALLTHRSSSSVPAVQPVEVRVPWWRRLFQ